MSAGALLGHHRQQLRASGLSDETIRTRGYWSATHPSDLETLGYRGEQVRVPALVVPIVSVVGVVVGTTIRPDHPRRDERDRVVKYDKVAGTPNVLDASPANDPAWRLAPTRPLVITEGPKKADAVAQAGTDAVDVVGVHTFLGRRPDVGQTLVIPDFDDVALVGRDVFVALDSDVTMKPAVRNGLVRLVGAIERRGGRARVVLIPPGPHNAKVGIDDYLAGVPIDDRPAALADLVANAVPVEAVPLVAADGRVAWPGVERGALPSAFERLPPTAGPDERLAAALADRAELAVLVRELQEERSLLVAIERNAKIGQEKATGRATLMALEAAARNDRRDPGAAEPDGGERWHVIPNAAIAEAAGLSEASVSHHQAKLAPLGLFARRTVHVRRGEARPDSGEIVDRPLSLTEYRRVRPMREALAALAVAAPPPEAPPKHGHGGWRPRCADHPGATVLKQTVYRCSVCRKTLGYSPTAPVDPDPTVQAALPDFMMKTGLPDVDDACEETLTLPYVLNTEELKSGATTPDFKLKTGAADGRGDRRGTTHGRD